MPEYLAPGVYVEEIEMGAKPIEGVSTSTLGFIGMATKGEINKPKLITNWGQFVMNFGRYTNDRPFLAPAVYGFFANGGARCFIVRINDNAQEADYVGTDGGPGNRTGLQCFNEIDEINIVSIPGITSETVQRAMIDHCESMKDRFAILDSEQDADIEAVKKQREKLASTKGYAALYYPWLKVQIEIEKSKDRIEFKKDFVPPSGYVAGIYARSDASRGVHKAPANENVRGVIDVSISVTKGEQETMNPLGINCIRFFSGRGIKVWGARTIADDALWKYINVRRLFLYLEESVEEGIQWVVFEPNDEKLWARVKQTITQFLTGVWKSGALMGLTPEEAFFVKCDRTTMTQDDIDNGRLIALIGVAPVKPAEFVIFRIAQWQGGSEVSE